MRTWNEPTKQARTFARVNARLAAPAIHSLEYDTIGICRLGDGVTRAPKDLSPENPERRRRHWAAYAILSSATRMVLFSVPGENALMPMVVIEEGTVVTLSLNLVLRRMIHTGPFDRGSAFLGFSKGHD
jgi:hypothetical protein